MKKDISKESPWRTHGIDTPFQDVLDRALEGEQVEVRERRDGIKYAVAGEAYTDAHVLPSGTVRVHGRLADRVTDMYPDVREERSHVGYVGWKFNAIERRPAAPTEWKPSSNTFAAALARLDMDRTHRTKDALVRDAVWAMTDGHCAKCGTRLTPGTFHVDHVKPRVWRGEDHVTNYQPLCRACNVGKGDRGTKDYRSDKVRGLLGEGAPVITSPA